MTKEYIVEKEMKYIHYIKDILENYKDFKHKNNTYVEFDIEKEENGLSILSISFDLDKQKYYIENLNKLREAINKQSKKTVIKMIEEANIGANPLFRKI